MDKGLGQDSKVICGHGYAQLSLPSKSVLSLIALLTIISNTGIIIINYFNCSGL